MSDEHSGAQAIAEEDLVRVTLEISSGATSGSEVFYTFAQLAARSEQMSAPVAPYGPTGR